ncbi:MAG: hypothetical protein WBD61_00415 [Desulfobulbales bacterium]
MKSKLLLNKFLCFISFLVVIAFITSCGGGGLSPDVTFGGKVLLQDGKPLEGIEVTFFVPKPLNIDSDGTWTVLTDENGWYSDWTYSSLGGSYITITPHHPDYIFSPDSYFLVKPFSDNLELNFTAIAN